jgi:cell division septation protein DedD
MDKIILELLRERAILVVPGLGAFVGIVRPSLYDHTSERILPPSREITFSNLNKTYDLTLAEHISKRNHCSLMEAGRMIEHFNADVWSTLQRGEVYPLPGIGHFHLDTQGLIQLQSRHSISHSDVFGLQAVPLRPLTATLATAIDKPLPQAAGELMQIQEKSLRVPGLKAKIPMQTVGWAASALLMGSLFGFMLDGFGGSGSSELNSSESTNINRSPRAQGLTYRGTIEQLPSNPDQENLEPVQPNSNQIVTEEYVGTDSRTNPTIEVTKAPEPQVQIEVKPAVLPPAYNAVYIIGSFGQTGNANKVKNKIRNMGFEVFTDKYNGLTRVGARISYNTKSELEEDLAYLRSEYGQVVRFKR